MNWLISALKIGAFLVVINIPVFFFVLGYLRR